VISGVCDFVRLCVLTLKQIQLELWIANGSHSVCIDLEVQKPNWVKVTQTPNVLLACICMSIGLLFSNYYFISFLLCSTKASDGDSLGLSMVTGNNLCVYQSFWEQVNSAAATDAFSFTGLCHSEHFERNFNWFFYWLCQRKFDSHHNGRQITNLAEIAAANRQQLRCWSCTI